ncbi:MAG: hypothetical protein F4Y40_05000 [Acidimicrobiia bacterium]|nr:hypothetical protein [Acidimicrobiia bacterium]
MRVNENIRYDPDDSCPLPVAAAVAMQGVMLILPTVVVIVVITSLAAGENDRYLSWAVFAALLVSGGATALQAGRLGRVGAGGIVFTCVSLSYLGISVLALAAGGPALLASLTMVVAVTQLSLARWLPSLRGLITPVVSGTALMLIAAGIMPIAFDRIDEVASGGSPAAGPVAAAVALGVTAVLALLASGVWRLWTPLIGIAAGSAASALFGSYDFRPVLDASWIGVPSPDLPALDLTPGAEFWALLPVFLIVSLVVGIKNIGDAVVVQQVSRRRPRAADFRLVQGALNVNGLGVLAAGLVGVPPTTIMSAQSSVLVGLTGVAYRRVGYLIGACLAALAFSPKLMAFLLTVPGPVAAAYLLVLMGMLFLEGMRTVLRDGLDYRKGLVVALALSIGMGLEGRTVFSDLLGETWGASLDSGMMSGGLVALLLTLVIEATGRRRTRLEVRLDMSALPDIDNHLNNLAVSLGWNSSSVERLRAAGEETLSSLLQPSDREAGDTPPRLVIVARPDNRVLEMDFIVVLSDDNLEDRLAYLDERADEPDEREISFRLLRHYASSVRHRKFHGAEIVTVKVDAS